MSALLEVRDLKVHFPVGGGLFGKPAGVVHAVDGVSLTLARNEILAVVGESGCGKSTLARAVLGLTAPTAGDVLLDGESVLGLSDVALRRYRRAVQMVFQDPFESLNPRKTVFATLAQPLRIHGIVPMADLRTEAARLLEAVGLAPGAPYLDRYPHQFSGGQRQRICIARSIAVRPRVIVADEAVSALDISIRAQILALMKTLQGEMGLSYVFITHDLGVVRSLCDRVCVMYLGQIVEEGPTERIFAQPRHPYTAALVEACPLPDPRRARAKAAPPLSGDIPSPLKPPPGCRFHTRCPVARPVCATEPPPERRFAGGQVARCHFAEEAATWPFGRLGAAAA
ncbi:ABC transporter ATP-binding protein [Aquabacter spiritensis]|uniref:Oligopeptide transport system ATP-binding protein n=1 Tax=Aquabacter spiritensis TaxID=933073 RepID=A0A4R3M842_9HYPH|nr:oligopeptide/dipeptide ABC transporter ATP-binding protein [Aquabacter spiritensis]TCT07807.1 oligopeptide transport system ATP-binding protein [Aquabacter spiritensis]